MSEETPETKKEAHKELQGKKKTSKKKVKNYTHAECSSEIGRLERANHQQSKYYKTVDRRMAVTV